MQQVDVSRAVVALGFDVEVLQDIQRLEQRRPLGPDVELVDLDALVRGHHRLFHPPPLGPSRSSPRCGKYPAREYFHSLIRCLLRSMEFAVCSSMAYPSASWMAGSSTSSRLKVPHSANMVRSPPGVPGGTAASGPYSGG